MRLRMCDMYMNKYNAMFKADGMVVEEWCVVRTSLWQWVSGTAGRGRGRLAQHPYVKPADYGPRPGESCDCFIEHSRRKCLRSPYCV